MVLVTKKTVYIVKSKHVLNYIKLQLAFFFLFIPVFAMCTHIYLHVPFPVCSLQREDCQFHEFPGKVHLRHVCGKPGSVQN